MNPKQIKQAYNQITHLWEQDDFDRENGIEQHRRALAFSKNKGNALDVGCGSTGRFIDLLLEQGYQPEGVDISDKMLELVKTKHPKITFYQEDICEWDLPKKYDFITAWDSIWHIPLSDQEGVITKLVQGLNTGGVFIFSCGGLDLPSEETDDYMGPEVYYSTLGLNGFTQLFLNLGCFCRHVEYDQYPESHAYFIVQKP